MSNKEYYKEWVKKHPNYHKKWKEEHPECVKKYNKRASMKKDGIQTETLSHAGNRYTRWTLEDVEKLKILSKSDALSNSEIAVKLHRTLYSINSKVNSLKRKGEM